MLAVLLDFNGTMFFDTSLHMEAWSEIYHELYPNNENSPDTRLFCGPHNDDILKSIAPWLDDQQRMQYSVKKEELYRLACARNPEKVHLANGTEDFLQLLQEKGIPFALASASIKANIDFYFDTFGLDRWFNKEDVVYDDGTYPNKGAMHLEAARRLGVDIADCVVIEDSLTSIRLARENGAGCVIAAGETAPASELEGLAHHIMVDFTEFDFAWLVRKDPVTF